LTLAEVEVISRGVNIAPKGKAKQSSTGYGGGPERAIDGNTSGSWVDNTSTHTAEGGQDPWWEVDLGAEKPLDAVVVWNRTDGELGMRLDGFMLTVLDAHRHPTFTRMGVSAPATSVRIPFGDDPVKGLRRAAIGAITALPGHDGETFTMLAGFVKAGDERDAAVQALRRLPRSAWPKDEVKPLLAAVIDYVGKLPPDERTEAAGLDAFQLGNDLASLLPTAEAKAARAKLGDLGVQVVLIRTLPHRMAYDRTKVYVEAGKPVVLVLENPDIMPHNLIIGTPGSLAEIGLASEKMALDPDALARNYIPRNAKVLHATRLLAPQESQRLSFTTPKTPGDYPYLCTFPGHWRVMYGTMKVVAKLDDVPAEELNAPPASEGNVAATRPFVRQWTVEDLTADLDQLDRNRSFERGKALFTAATCVQCHKVGGEGGVIGPDFAELGKKLAEKKMTRPEVLREVIHPSAVIDPKYRTLIVETKAGAAAAGESSGQADRSEARRHRHEDGVEDLADAGGPAGDADQGRDFGSVGVCDSQRGREASGVWREIAARDRG
jgi:putative heme-binding domain-containing protein